MKFEAEGKGAAKSYRERVVSSASPAGFRAEP